MHHITSFQRYKVTIPEGDPKPTRSYVHKLQMAPDEYNLPVVQAGDVVGIHWQMVSCDKRKTMERSRDLSDNALAIEADLDPEKISDSNPPKVPFVVPAFLSNSVVGAKVGERLEVIFPTDTPRLPGHLDKEDAPSCWS